jgi:hypothetical protein
MVKYKRPNCQFNLKEKNNPYSTLGWNVKKFSPGVLLLELSNIFLDKFKKWFGP